MMIVIVTVEMIVITVDGEGDDGHLADIDDHGDYSHDEGGNGHDGDGGAESHNDDD